MSLKKKSEATGMRGAGKIPRSSLLSTGSTLLNLACSGNPFGGFAQGKYHFLVGDSASGKTFLCITCLAEAARDKRYKKHRLLYDNGEDGGLLDIKRLFGKEAERRIEPPARTKIGVPVYSSDVEGFFYNIDDALEDGRPFVYVLDSMDGLTSEAEGKKFDEQKAAKRKGNKTAGTYTDGKAKINSSHVRQVVGRLRKTPSILVITAQTRDNLGFGFEKKSRAGGRALTFYATVETWSSVVGQIKKTVRKKPRVIGVTTEIRVKKNRMTGELHRVRVPIYPSYGIDDIGSCIDYLIEEGWWSVKGTKITASEPFLSDTREGLIREVEEGGFMRTLQREVGACWNDIQEKSSLNRRPRYADEEHK